MKLGKNPKNPPSWQGVKSLGVPDDELVLGAQFKLGDKLEREASIVLIALGE